jgi:hypothetical protein
MARHHYVPQFLLERWATRGRFIAYYFESAAAKVIENAKAIVASACQIPDLNTFYGVDKSQRDAPETRFFTPHVDTPAAAALQVMLADGIKALTKKQRIDWARLLISFAVRTPESLREMGPEETKKAFKLVGAIAKGPPEDEQKVTELIEANMQLFQRNFPLNIAMQLSSDSQKLAAVAEMKWWLRRWSGPTVFIGDRPLLTYPRMQRPCGIPLDNSSCMIILPIAPNVIFCASASPKTKDKMRSMSLGKIARVVNEEMIYRSESVYATDKSFGSFIIPRMKGKASGTWQPSSR